jgi:OmcA/MtrC family decaheme c-type cytochrome
MNQLHRTLLAACVLAAACTGPAGETGKPCSVKDNNNGSATVTCPDGTTVTVTSGTNGTNGTNGTAGMNGTNGTAGVNGTSCTLVINADAGSKTISCTDGTSVTLLDGRNGNNANDIVDFAKLNERELAEDDFQVSVQSVSNVARPVVRFTVRTAKGASVRNIAPSNFAGISLLQLVPSNTADGGNGLGIDTWVSHISNCATCTSSTEAATSTSLVDNGDGTYVYTFLKDVVNPTAFDGGTAVAGVVFDANAVHRFAMRLSDSARLNPYRPVDVTFDFIPASGANVDGQNDKVNQANCLSCHTQWRANAKNLAGATPFHAGQRYDVRSCVVCHNDQRKWSGNAVSGNPIIAEPTIDVNGTMTPPAGRTNVAVLRGEAVINLPVFAHKIHAGDLLSLKGNYAGLGTEITEFAFPQDVRNCTKCHSNAAKADNWKTRPSRRVCGSCHDAVNFVTGQGHGTANLPQADDSRCTICHDAAFIVDKHRPVAKPDPINALLVPGGNSNTHAAFVGSAANPPPGARVFRYDLASVTGVDAGSGNVNPQLRFRFVEGDAGVVFNQYDGGSGAGLLDNFIGGPSAYCVWSMTQDGIAKPADFNAASSVYLRSAWAGTAAGTTASTMTGPDSTGYYTLTITGTLVPATASMLTCGLGYSYNATSAQPLTQTNVMAYPFNASNRSGGLSIPMQNVWKVATGFTGRRGASSSANTTGHIVTTAKCAQCHNEIGVSPSYHAGQRNDAPTCAFCHTPNRTSSAWTAGSQSFIHAIHSAKKRTVPFNWHAVATTTEEGTSVEGFFGVEYPGKLNVCESCHNPGMYDFSNSWYSMSNVATRLQQTVATGVYDVSTLPDGGIPSLRFSVSPYVVADGGVNYGSGYAYSVASQVVTQAQSTTLVISPIASTCFGCHDSAASKLHMEGNGATIYGARAQASANVEQCLICHGPGKAAAIKEVHTR